MRLVAEGADALTSTQHLPSARLVEVGLVVTYCRPFSGPPRAGKPPRHKVDELAPPDDLHALLFVVRSKLYAHNDDSWEHRRRAVDPFGEHSYSEEYRALDPEVLPQIRDLAADQFDRFKWARLELEQTLRDAGVPPEPYV